MYKSFEKISMQNIMVPNFMEELVEDDDGQLQSTSIFAHSHLNDTQPVGARLDTTPPRKKRNLPGNPDPEAEVVALSPKTLMATNRYVCEVCHKGFQRDQNLQLHRRGHNLPWKLKQRPATQAKKRVFVCPEAGCVHHNPGRALGDLTGIKKHYCRKHGDKKWKCDKCSKRYAVQSDWKAHAKICGTREYRCDCGTVFSRKDSFVTHRAFCDALSEENYRANRNLAASTGPILHAQARDLFSSCADHAINHHPPSLSSNQTMTASSFDPFQGATSQSSSSKAAAIGGLMSSSSPLALASAYTSATALLQKAAEMGSKTSDSSLSPIFMRGFSTGYFNGSKGSSTSVFDSRISAAPNGTLGAGLDSAGGRGEIAEMGMYDLSMGEKMTVDFLGVAPPAFDSRRRYGDDEPEFGSMSMHTQW